MQDAVSQSRSVTTASGAVVDLQPLVIAARDFRRNVLRDAEHEGDTSLARTHVADVTIGMRIAVKHLLGDEALAIFEEDISES